MAEKEKGFKLVSVEEVPASMKSSSMHRDIAEDFMKKGLKNVKVEGFPKSSVGYLRKIIDEMKLPIIVSVRHEDVYLTKGKL